MRKLKAAVGGIGNIGSKHSELYYLLENFDLAVVCDIDQEKADKASSKFNYKAIYSVESFLAEMPIEIASVCTEWVEIGEDHY